LSDCTENVAMGLAAAGSKVVRQRAQSYVEVADQGSGAYIECQRFEWILLRQNLVAGGVNKDLGCRRVECSAIEAHKTGPVPGNPVLSSNVDLDVDLNVMVMVNGAENGTETEDERVDMVDMVDRADRVCWEGQGGRRGRGIEGDIGFGSEFGSGSGSGSGSCFGRG